MSESDSEIEDVSQHTAALKRLQSKDPDFYEFLKENDKELLDFKDSDDQGEESEEEMEQNDEDDDSDEASSFSKKTLSVERLDDVKNEIKNAPAVSTCRQLVGVFRISIEQADSFSKKKTSMSGSDLFNEVIKLCFVEFIPLTKKILKVNEEKSFDPSKSKLWMVMRPIIRSYLAELLKMISLMNESPIMTTILKHVINLVPYFKKFAKLSQKLVTRVISLWCTNEESVRVLSLLIIVRTSKALPKGSVGPILKQMHYAYVCNTKFTSLSTWPMINFMKRSLTEVYSLHPGIAYEHAFVYIRQLSIHLRNAITVRKKESFKPVYNWQYVHCILHWVHLVCTLRDNNAIKTLIYPLVQTIIGVINLLPIAKYIPLRVHLIKALIQISKETGTTYIPILPLVLEILTITEYNSKKSASNKPFHLACALKVVESQLHDPTFKNSCIENVCELLKEYFIIYSSNMAFPELALPAVLQIKQFMKQCRDSTYNQRLKWILQKIEENSAFISDKRRLVTFQITDDALIKRWEENIRQVGTPLSKLQNSQAKNHITPVGKKLKTEHK